MSKGQVYLYFVNGKVEYLTAHSKEQAQVIVEKKGYLHTQVYLDTHKFVVVEITKTKFDMEYLHSVCLFGYIKGRGDQRYAKLCKLGASPLYDTVSFITPRLGLSFYKLAGGSLPPLPVEDVMKSNRIGTLENLYVNLVVKNRDLSHVIYQAEDSAWNW